MYQNLICWAILMDNQGTDQPCEQAHAALKLRNQYIIECVFYHAKTGQFLPDITNGNPIDIGTTFMCFIM